MKTISLQTSPQHLENELPKLAEQNIELVFLFSSRQNIVEYGLEKMIKTALPKTTLVGCSTSGEIGATVEDDTVSLLGIRFSETSFQTYAIEIPSSDDSYKAGLEAGLRIEPKNLSHVFVLLPGLNVNGEQFTKGICSALPENTNVSGGMAGDGLGFEKTFTVHNTNVSDKHAVLVAFYGDKVQVKTCSRGGWRPFGPQRRVTKVEGNVLYEVDNEPALQLYKKYLGDKASDLPSSGLLYPFAIMQNEANNKSGLIRTILDINEADQSLILAGDMEKGQLVCLMHATTDELVEGSAEAAGIINDQVNPATGGAVICVSCVGRKILMGDDTEEELDAIKDIFQDHAIAGFYSYGEICSYDETGRPELHNQTMTITYITE